MRRRRTVRDNGAAVGEVFITVSGADLGRALVNR
jgi:hypothetical protein